MSKMRLYTIQPGRKYSDAGILERITPHFTNSIRFILQFDASVKYQAKDPAKQYSWHKAFGFREISLQDNSARVGFRWNTERNLLEFAPYVHWRGVNLGATSPAVLYSTANVNEEIRCLIACQGFNKYRFEVGGKVAYVDRGGGGLMKVWSWPYLEADLIDPHPVKIKLKIL